MDIETPVTFGGLVIAVIFMVVFNFAPRLYDWLKLRAEIREREMKAKLEAQERAAQVEIDKEDKAWDTVVNEYNRQLERGQKLEAELEQLRPLALTNAVMEQKMKQCKEDKEDWKAHALSLEAQLTEHNIIPRPFKRLPRDESDTDKLKTISRKMKAIKENHEVDKVATEGSPTLVFPTPPVTKDGE